MPVLQLQFNLSALETSPCEVAKTNAVSFELHKVLGTVGMAFYAEHSVRLFFGKSVAKWQHKYNQSAFFCDARKCSKFKRNECNAKCSLDSTLTVLQMSNKLSQFSQWKWNTEIKQQQKKTFHLMAICLLFKLLHVTEREFLAIAIFCAYQTKLLNVNNNHRRGSILVSRARGSSGH